MPPESIHQNAKEFFMQQALAQAKAAFDQDEVPVGAVLVYDQKIIATGYNRVEQTKDPSQHAEMICLRKAKDFFCDWRMNGAILYTTLEPCVMCLGMCFQSRIKKVVYGAKDLRLGACGSWVDLLQRKHPIHPIGVEGGVLAEESSTLLKQFFIQKRHEKSGKSIQTL